MGMKPVELPMWHLAWCFSKASMVHSAQVNQCGCHAQNDTPNGLHPHVHCCGGSYEPFSDGGLNGSPPCLGWPNQVAGWAPTLPPLWGNPCFQPSGTVWKKGVVPMGMDSVA